MPTQSKSTSANKNNSSLRTPIQNNNISQPKTLNAAKSNKNLPDKPALCILKTNEGDKVGAIQWQNKQSKRPSSPGHSPTSKEPKISNETKSALL